MSRIFAIRCKATNEFIAYNTRCAWTKAGNANNGYGKVFVPFDEQDTHELVELTSYFYNYEDLCK